MSPLDRLQELLDERGVKYERRSLADYDRVSVEYVMWRGVGGLEFNAIRSYSDPDMLYIDNTVISPEDAVDVTVGRETCRNVSDVDGIFACSECKCQIEGMTVLNGPRRWVEPPYCPNCGRQVSV